MDTDKIGTRETVLIPPGTKPIVVIQNILPWESRLVETICDHDAANDRCDDIGRVVHRASWKKARYSNVRTLGVSKEARCIPRVGRNARATITDPRVINNKETKVFNASTSSFQRTVGKWRLSQ
jgi:hypothetical protein